MHPFNTRVRTVETVFGTERLQLGVIDAATTDAYLYGQCLALAVALAHLLELGTVEVIGSDCPPDCGCGASRPHPDAPIYLDHVLVRDRDLVMDVTGVHDPVRREAEYHQIVHGPLDQERHESCTEPECSYGTYTVSASLAARSARFWEMPDQDWNAALATAAALLTRVAAPTGTVFDTYREGRNLQLLLDRMASFHARYIGAEPLALAA